MVDAVANNKIKFGQHHLNAIQSQSQCSYPRDPTYKHMAYACGVSHSTFERWMADLELRPRIEDAIQKGRMDLRDVVVTNFIKCLKAGRPGVVIFAAKAILGWNEDGPKEDDSDEERTRVVGMSNGDRYELYAGATLIKGSKDSDDDSEGS